MLDSNDEAVSGVSAADAAPPPAGKAALEIKVQPADAIGGPVPLSDKPSEDKDQALEIQALEIKLQPADAIGGPAPLKDKPLEDRDKAKDKALEIKVQPADTLRGAASRKDKRRADKNADKNNEGASKRTAFSLFGRVVRFGARMAFVAGLCGLAWLAGMYYSRGGHSLRDLVRPLRAAEVPPSAERGEMVSTMRQMAEDIRALKASVAEKGAAQDAGMQTASNIQENPQQTQPEPAPAAAGPTVADLASRVDKLESESTAKLAQVNERLASIEQQIAAARAASAPRPQPVHKRVHLHDAFDPSRDPAAPGAPRPLGIR